MIGCRTYVSAVPGCDRVLVVMLPGAGFAPGAFADRGMVAAVQEGGVQVNVVAADIPLDLYLEGDIATALDRAVVAPARARGYARIWLLGISLGGMGALLYASAHAAEIEGVVLLAPFLGTQGTIAEIGAAGGLADWRAAGSAATRAEIRMLCWLQAYVTGPPMRPALLLGYGRCDRFAQGHRILAACLPPDRVVTTAGGHDWPTWLALARLLWRHALGPPPIALDWTSKSPAPYHDDAANSGSDDPQA